MCPNALALYVAGKAGTKIEASGLVAQGMRKPGSWAFELPFLFRYNQQSGPRE